MKQSFPLCIARMAVLLICLGCNSLWAAPDDPGAEFRLMSESELNEEWQGFFGPEAFSPIPLPSYIQPGGFYNERVFYFSEPGTVRLEGTGAAGKLYVGQQTLNYRAAVHPFSPDSAISYFRILENNDFGDLILEQFPGLEQRAQNEDGSWDLLSIGDELGIPLEMGSYFADWTNLPNFQWVLSSILVRRASQQNPAQLLLLDQGVLNNIPQESVQRGGNRTGILAASYDPGMLAELNSGMGFAMWMVIAAGVGVLLIGLLIGLLLGRGRRRRNRLQEGEMEILEEDPRYVALAEDLNQPLEPYDLLKVLSVHFDESESVASVLTQTKLLLDKALKTEGDSNIQGNQEPTAADESEEPAPEKNSGRIRISMANQDRKRPASTEAEEPKDKKASEKPREKDREKDRSEDRPRRKEPEVREVIREVVKEVVIKETPNKDKLLIRLANQETPEEKLLAAVSFFDAEFEMEGQMNENLKTVLRGYRTLKKVKDGFEGNKLRSALNTLALSFGGGHTEKVRVLMDRSELIDQFVRDIEADQKAPEAERTDDRGKTAGQFAELIRALGCMERVARKELGDRSVADYTKAAENLMNGFLLDGIARDMDNKKPFEEIRARLDGRYGLFRDDVRFAQHQIPEEALGRAHKLVLAFAGQVGDNEYYRAFMDRYGDLFQKLSSYEDPPSLEQLREWWSQVFEMVLHVFDYFRFSMNPKEGNLANLNVLLITKGLKLHELPDGDVRPFSERVTDVPRAVRNAREMARSIGISRLDRVLIDGYYVHPKALEPVE